MILKRHLFHLIFLFFTLTVNQLWAQTNISGVINTYTSVIDITPCNPCTPSCTTVTVSSIAGTGAAGGFNVGDRVIMMQMKGATIDLSNSVVFGSIAAYGNAGFFEKLTIATIVGSTITFTTGLVNTYDVAGIIQLIKFPQYVNANVTAALTALPWNGQIGGVLAFEATGTLTLSANIDVSGLGFRGGLSLTSGFSFPCGLINYSYPFTGDYSFAAEKGEGIAIGIAGYELGRGAWANGGGGGNSHNGGGGGGANGGAGGIGGKEYIGCSTSSDPSGIGGYALTGFTGARIFLGGGGGAGHQNNNVGTSGATGGGIVMIKANQIIGNGFSILANGNDALNTFNQGNDAAGGGGAGGSIQLDVPTFSGVLAVRANGGKGGDMIEPVCHATGSGGGGGRICFTAASVSSGVTTSVLGGVPGNASANCATTSGLPTYGATAGAVGIIGFSCTIAVPPGPKTISVNLGGDTRLCNPVSVTLDSRAVGPWYTYAWYKDGTLLSSETNQTLFVTGPGRYKVIVTSTGCIPGKDSVDITSDAAIPDDSFFCAPPPKSVQLNVIGSGKYKWWTAATGGTAVGTGPSFNTPLLSTTTTYYVQDTATFSRGGFTPTSMLSGFTARGGASNTYMGFNAFTAFRLDTVTAYIRTFNTNNDNMVVNLRQRGNPTPLATKSLLVTGPCNCTYDQPVKFYLGFDIPVGNEYYLEYASGGVNVHWDNSGASYPYTSPGIVSIYGPVDGTGAATLGWAPTSYGFFYDWKISAGTQCDRVPVRAILDCTLPVELLSFTGEKTKNGVLLNWNTASEKDNRYFLLERSTDGKDFLPIAEIEGNGTTKLFHKYSYLDSSPLAGIIYYRLVQVDFNGAKNYSHVVSIAHEQNIQLSIYPNPFASAATLLVRSTEVVSFDLRITDVTGKLVHSSHSHPVNQPLAVGKEISAGVYLIEILSAQHRLIHRLVKINE